MRPGVTVVNDRWAKILGYRASDLNPLTSHRWQQIVHPDDTPGLLDWVHQTTSERRWSVGRELRLWCRAGHWVRVLTRGQATEWDTVSHPLQVSGVHLDVSAAKVLEADLARERDTLARIMETSVSGIVAVDGNGRSSGQSGSGGSCGFQ